MDATAELPTLNAHRAGTGPTLVLLPGLASPIGEFGTVLPELARRYEVVALDLPGQGGSPALPPPLRPDVGTLTDAVERELDRQGVSVAHVLGVSLGGRIALELARRHRAASVVAIAPTGPVTPPERAYQAAMFVGARLVTGALAPVAGPLMRLAGPRTALLGFLRVRGWRTPPDEAAALVREFATAEDFWRLVRYAVLPEATLDHRMVDCPVVIAQGTHDVLATSQSFWLAALVPGARFRLLPFAGHSSIADVPQRVIALVAEAVDAAAAR
ncbi:alpha/beta fold hydrolase [Modestobacter excelsi]|uniref:alpha/beta fold hydrolase n=1 Tax=Modestobacter excelsi TaxID=2213161 RepID=UPI00110CD5C2|nr:alpha/beta fold hydrolase [Modestobacter excelsi]